MYDANCNLNDSNVELLVDDYQALYIHIPFCVKKCNYCAFNSIVGTELLMNDYVDVLCKEIKRGPVSKNIKTIYIGGGTPTLMKIKQLSKILNVILCNYGLCSNAELTIEANPGTIDEKYLRDLNQLGINRISIGVQTFNDVLLKQIGRIHSKVDAVSAVISAKKFFNNVSLDLMYGLPNQTMNTVIDSVNTATNFDVNHISIYGLEIEEGTTFYKMQSQGILTLPTDDESADMYDYITTELPRRGFARYEISNFAKTGFESKHNLGYWNDVKYLGFGAGAHSYNGMERRSNIKNVVDYISGINNGDDVSSLEEVVDRQAAMEEFCFLALRTAYGIDRKKFKTKFGVDIEQIFNNVIQKLYLQRLIDITEDRVFLTSYGMKLGNLVFSEFLL